MKNNNIPCKAISVICHVYNSEHDINLPFTSRFMVREEDAQLFMYSMIATIDKHRLPSMEVNVEDSTINDYSNLLDIDQICEYLDRRIEELKGENGLALTLK